ncbi:MAG: right-handed parallel beta-helix repeat-containing protein [Akkermansiaceae bacterium]
MTPVDARRILGLGPDEDPRIHLDEFKQARERIGELVRTAPNDTIADRYQKGLIEFDQALAAIQESLEAAGLASPPLPASTSPELPVAAPEIEHPPVPDPSTRPSRTLSLTAWLLILLTGIGGGGWIYLKDVERKKEQLQTRITFLVRQGSTLIENRRWPDASKAFDEIEGLAPGSPSAQMGRRSIEAGMAEEQTQFVGYWTGQAIAELEAGRLDEAAAATRQVLDKSPHHQETIAILHRIADARLRQARAKIITAARAQLDERDWHAAIETVRSMLTTTPDDPDAKSIIADATAAIEKTAADQAKAAALLLQASARDQGEFDQQALDWLREANSLDPGNPEITALLEKLSTYTRTLRVPGDFATPAEALAAARDRDRIILTEQVWKGPLIINAAVDLQGSDPTKTTIECAPEDGSAITIGPDAKGARISGIGFRHESFAVGTERYSVALVRGGRAVFVDCRFASASGHGLAVVEKGQAIVDRCRFSDNGWNGIAAMGEGSTLEVKDSECRDNFEHGIESWNGAAVILTNNRCEGNSRNGIHADNGLASATITGNQLIANREFGLVLGSAGSGKISGNSARANLLGGFVIRAAAANSSVTRNQATLNQGPGLILEKGLPSAAYADNELTKNSNSQMLTEANLSQPDEIPAQPSERD